MGHSHALSDVLVLLAAAVFIVAIFRQLNLSPVLGFLFAGAAIGPYGLELAGDLQEKSYIAEFGVVFLLFMIGLELSFERLKAMRAYVFGLGSLQVLITSLIFAFALHHLGVKTEVAIVIAIALAMSSTAIVMQVIAEQGEQISQVGRISFAILLLQDLAVVPLLVFVPLASQENGKLLEALGQAGVKAFLVLAGIVLVGKLLLKPLFRLVAAAKSAELFAAVTLLITLGAAWATDQAGLSLALGAFIAGLLVAETEYNRQVEADIMPFKGLLLGFFFMTVGMSINLEELSRKFVQIALFSGGIIFVKAAVIVALCRVFGMRWRTCVMSGLLLSQGSEFAFVLFNLAKEERLINAETAQTLMVTVTVTMALTPLITSAGKFVLEKIEDSKKTGADSWMKVTEIAEENDDRVGHFIICGFGRVGRSVARFLASDGISFVAIDNEPKRVKKGREDRLPVYFGDATRIEVLNSLRAEEAKGVIIAMHDSKLATRLTEVIRNAFPELQIIVRAKENTHTEELEKAGANVVIPEINELSIQIGSAALRIIGTPEDEIDRVAEDFRGS